MAGGAVVSARGQDRTEAGRPAEAGQAQDEQAAGAQLLPSSASASVAGSFTLRAGTTVEMACL
jgi:hypothetical protein